VFWAARQARSASYGDRGFPDVTRSGSLGTDEGGEPEVSGNYDTHYDNAPRHYKGRFMNMITLEANMGTLPSSGETSV
jgi:hypothetical protein